jgi:DNA-directed RNA polymerase specialized sigma24 family protein
MTTNAISIPSAYIHRAPGAEDIAQVLDRLQPNQRTQRLDIFAEHLEHIEAALLRGVTQTAIREALSDSGLKLSSATFKKLLSAARLRQANCGHGPDGSSGVIA